MQAFSDVENNFHDQVLLYASDKDPRKNPSHIYGFLKAALHSLTTYKWQQ